MGSGGDAGKGSGGACLPADSSGDDAINAAEEFPSIETPYGPAEQSLSNEALAARDSVKNGASLFKGGSIGHSLPPEESQFFSLEDPAWGSVHHQGSPRRGYTPWRRHRGGHQPGRLHAGGRMLIDSLEQLYSSVYVLIELLQRTGHSDLADRLSTALGGSTSGEILGALWFELRSIQERSLGGQDINDAIEYIERTLGPPRAR
jgi:hypothetical protein